MIAAEVGRSEHSNLQIPTSKRKQVSHSPDLCLSLLWVGEPPSESAYSTPGIINSSLFVFCQYTSSLSWSTLTYILRFSELILIGAQIGTKLEHKSYCWQWAASLFGFFVLLAAWLNLLSSKNWRAEAIFVFYLSVCWIVNYLIWPRWQKGIGFSVGGALRTGVFVAFDGSDGAD